MQVLLTRPITQNQQLTKLISDAGYKVLLFPSLKIEALHPRLSGTNFDWIIFISINAASYAKSYITKLNLTSSTVATVGSATKNYLNSVGVKVNIYPDSDASSKSLLEMEATQGLTAKNVLIIRGEGGLETLKTQLVKQGNTVEYLEVYRRVCADLSDLHQQSLQKFLAQEDGIITIFSADSLFSFIKLVNKIGQHLLAPLLDYPLILFSNRIVEQAKKAGFKNCYHVKIGDDNMLVSTIKYITTN